MKIIEGKQKISDQQLISSQVEEIFPKEKPENKNTNYKQKKIKRIQTSRCKSKLKITFQNTDCENQSKQEPKTYHPRKHTILINNPRNNKKQKNNQNNHFLTRYPRNR